MILRRLGAMLLLLALLMSAMGVQSADARTREVVATSCSSIVMNRVGDTLYTDFVYKDGVLTQVYSNNQTTYKVDLYLFGYDTYGDAIWTDHVMDTDYLWTVPRYVNGKQVRGKLVEVRVQYVEPRYGKTTSKVVAGGRAPGAKYASCELRNLVSLPA